MDEFDWASVVGTDLAVALADIRTRCEETVQRETLLHYTDHTIHHLDKVAQNFIRLAKSISNPQKRLNNFEYFVGLSSCYLHDVALQSTIGSKKDISRINAYDQVVQRNQHGVAAGNWISKQVGGESLGPDLAVARNDTVRKLASLAAPICTHHCSDIPSEPLKDKKLLNQQIRMQLLLGMVRLADALDLDFERVRMELLDQNQLPVESQIHWWRHHYTASVSVDELATIEITMSFPKMSKPHIDLFKTDTYDYIQSELVQFMKLFRQNGLPVTLLPIATEDSWGPTLRHPSEELSEFLNQRCGGVAQEYKNNPVPQLSRGKKKTVGFAYENWSVQGHPWVDLPTSVSSKNYVETGQLSGYLEQMESFIDAGVGEMRMVYGARGIGKTTFLNSISDKFASFCDVVYLDMSIIFASIDSPGRMYAWMFGRLMNELGDSGPPPDEQEVPARLREVIDEHERPVIVLIDNLDRFVTQPDIEIIKKFFERAQGSLQDLKRKATIIITAHENWQDFVKEEQLNYIGASPSWNLSPMSASDIRALLDNRLKISGSSYGNVFSDSAFTKIHRLSGGNPRQAIGDCAYLFESAIRKRQRVIDDEFIQSFRAGDLKHRLHGEVISGAKEFPIIGKMLDRLCAFYDYVEQSPRGQDFAWDLLENVFAVGSLPISSVPDELRTPFASVAEMGSVGNSLAWKPSKPILAALQLLKKEKEISRDEFFSHFKARPIRPVGGSRPVSLHASLKISDKSKPIYRLIEESNVRKNRASNKNTKLRALRYKVEYWLVLVLQELSVALPAGYEFHEHGVVKQGTNIRNKQPWKHQRDFKDLITSCRRARPRFNSLAAMTLIDANTVSSLRGGKETVPEEEVKLVELVARSIEADVMRILANGD